jgi:nucleoside-diphosphate-sugar epimerase
VAWRYNVDATKMVFEQAADLGVGRCVFASTYSNYGLIPGWRAGDGRIPLNPQSLYAETKIASEQFLLGQKDGPTAPLSFRFATLYGIFPRTGSI